MSESEDDYVPAKVLRFVTRIGTLMDIGTKNEGIYNLLINVGAEDDVKKDARVLVYALGEEIMDPDSNESLGHFEIVRGEGRVSVVQDKISIVRSSRTKQVQQILSTAGVLAAMSGRSSSEVVEKTEQQPFISPQIGDLVRFI